MAKILIVDDDKHSIDLLYASLRNRYDLDNAGNGDEALHKIRVSEYDLVILDLLLPDMSGTNVCMEIRRMGFNMPILMLTAVSSSRQTEHNLDVGADDYLVKPYEPPILLARIRALLRRSGAQLSITGSFLKAGDLEFDTKSRKLKKGTKDVHLLPREAALLEFFLRYPDHLFSVETLLKRVWETDSDAMNDTVRAHVKSLRKKIDSEGASSYITNLRGQGYRFESNHNGGQQR